MSLIVSLCHLAQHHRTSLEAAKVVGRSMQVSELRITQESRRFKEVYGGLVLSGWGGEGRRDRERGSMEGGRRMVDSGPGGGGVSQSLQDQGRPWIPFLRWESKWRFRSYTDASMPLILYLKLIRIVQFISGRSLCFLIAGESPRPTHLLCLLPSRPLLKSPGFLWPG